MNRKNSKITIMKWIHPQDAPNDMAITRKRINMSLEAHKDNSLIPTYRSQCLNAPRSTSQQPLNQSQIASISSGPPLELSRTLTPNLAITESDKKQDN